MHKMKRFLSVVLTVCMLVSILSTGALAVSISEKPDNGTTKGQPFAPGTGGSQNFRIPGIVTLNDGTLIAACDARWNHAGDGAGLDTIVSVSTDNGENWTYTFANYLGDNGDVYNNLSTCIIDPGIGTDGETAYLIADLWPAGIALNTSKYGPIANENGFDDNGNLLLRALSEDTITIGASGYNTMAGEVSRYTYYLDLKTLTLHNADGSAIEGYNVDAYFNITGDGVNTNLFFADSPYQPYPTDYLYMTTSTDGLNWSAPTLLNLQEETEQTLLVGPGNGTYDEVNDRLIFTAYEHTSGYERTSLIWMDSKGNWYRSEDATNNPNNKSSEATAVVLEDGTVRVFFRDWSSYLNYSDYVFDESVNNYVVTNREVSTKAAKTSNNQLTSILYSEKIEGKEAVLVACAAYPGSRKDGHLYVFLVEEDNSMTLAYDYDIFPGETENYAYNCISEMEDGRIALLYENAGAAITFHVIDMEDVLVRENDPSLSFVEFELLDGYSKTFTDNSGCYVGADDSELDTNVATLEMTGEEIITNAAMVLSNSANIDLDSCQYTFTAVEDDCFAVSATTAEGTTVYLNHFATSNSNIPNIPSTAGKIKVLEGAFENMFQLKAQIIPGYTDNRIRTLHFYVNNSTPYWDRCSNDTDKACHEYLFRKAAAGETASTEIPGYVQLTSVSEVVDGGKYLIAAKSDAGNWYVLNPSTSSTKEAHVAKVMGPTVGGYTELTFTGTGAGYTEVLIGSTVYKITTHAVADVTLDIPVGTSATVTEPNGNNAEADVSQLDQTIASLTMVGYDGTFENGLSLNPVTELTTGKYVIINTRAKKIVNNTRNGSGLLLSGAKTDEIADSAIWTITQVNGGYTVQDGNGKYMTIGNGNANVVDAQNVLALNVTGTVWNIGQGGQWLNDYGGHGTTAAGHGSVDGGSYFHIYSYTDTPHDAGTELTFNGVRIGTTNLLLGHTRYQINVTGETHDVDLEFTESETVIIDGDHTQAPLIGLDTGVANVTLAPVAYGYVTTTNSNGAATGYDTENPVNLADCLYTFTKNTDGTYTVSATAANGTTVYLNHFSSGNNNPNIADPAGKIEVSMTTDNSYRFKLLAKNIGGSAADRTLHFHRECYIGSNDSDGQYPFWNRCGNDTAHDCREFLYRPVRANETSSAEIPGYVKVTSMDEIVDGGQYLIVNNTSNTTNDLYVLRPTTDTNKYLHVAKVADAATVDTLVTITGAGVGDTTLTLPGHYFEINVVKEYIAQQFDSSKIAGYASSNDSGDGSNIKEAFNGTKNDAGDYWASVPNNSFIDGNEYLIADLKGKYLIDKVAYTRRSIVNATGNLEDYVIWVSDDKVTWTEAARGTIDRNNLTTTITFNEPVMTRYVKLTATKAYHWDGPENDGPDDLRNTVMACSEFEIFQMVCKEGQHIEGEPVKAYDGDGSYEEVYYCVDCGKEMRRVDVEKFSISGTSMTMANSLNMNFAFDKAYMSDWTGCYAKIVKEYADGTTREQEIAIDAVNNVTEAFGVTSCYVTFVGIAAKEMTDNIHVTIYNKDGVAISEPYTDTVRNQAMRNLANNAAKTTDPELVALNNTMVVDMLIYGAKAQELADYKMDDLATDLLTAEQKAFATESVALENTMEHSEGIEYKANVKMLSNLQFMMAFSGIDPEKVEARITFDKWSKRENDPSTVITIDGLDFVESGRFYYFTIDKTVVADGRQPINCKIIDKKSGAIVAEVTDSIASYAARTTSTNKPLYEAIMKFSDSAKAYLTEKNN